MRWKRGPIVREPARLGKDANDVPAAPKKTDARDGKVETNALPRLV